MSNTVIYNEIKQKLDELYRKISPYDLEWIEDAEKVFLLFTEFEKLKDFLNAVKVVKKELETKNENEKIRKIDYLLKILESNEPDFLIERLKSKGKTIATTKASIKKAINDSSLRILEQVRLGKRDAVIGMLMRIFVVNQTKMPEELIEALKPKYDINLFRAFIYAFLSSFIESKNVGGQDGE